MATKQEIEHFMNALNEKIRVFDVSFRHREKNLQALADLEITAIQRRDFLEVYIKISLGKPNKSVDCMSFHPAEFKIKYPFK
jgi:hypothetical protein